MTIGKAFLVAALLSMISAGAARANQDETLKSDDIKVIDFEELQYPGLARNAGIQGVVVLRAMLDDQGAVVSAMAIAGNELLIAASLTNVKKWRFRPNARMAVVVIYNFTLLDGRCKSGSSVFNLRGDNFTTIIACRKTPQ